MAQMKEPIKTPEKKLNKTETSNLIDAELKSLVIRMLNELSEDLNSIKEDQSEMDTQTEMKDNLQEIKSTVDESNNQNSDLEFKEAKTPHQNSQKKKRIQKNEYGVRSLWDNFNRTNIHIIGVLEGKEREQEIETLFEKIMTENLPHLVKEIGIHVQEVQRVSKQDECKRPTPKYIIIKIQRVKDT